MNPLDSRIVLHGHLNESPTTVKGGLVEEDVTMVLEAAQPAIANYRAAFGDRFWGIVTLRLSVAADGGVDTATILLDRIVPAKVGAGELPSRGAIIEILGNLKFPAGDEPSQITLAASIGPTPSDLSA